MYICIYDVCRTTGHGQNVIYLEVTQSTVVAIVAFIVHSFNYLVLEVLRPNSRGGGGSGGLAQIDQTRGGATYWRSTQSISKMIHFHCCLSCFCFAFSLSLSLPLSPTFFFFLGYRSRGRRERARLSSVCSCSSRYVRLHAGRAYTVGQLIPPFLFCWNEKVRVFWREADVKNLLLSILMFDSRNSVECTSWLASLSKDILLSVIQIYYRSRKKINTSFAKSFTIQKQMLCR